jgi:hypothetical protein
MGVNTIGQRLIYENAANMLRNNGLNVANAKLTQSYLRLEVLATVNSNVWTFTVLQSSNQFGTENRLTLQDSFVVSECGIFWFIPTASGSPGPSNSPLFSWPNPNTFTTTNAATSAESLYNSYLTLNVNKDIVVPSWDVYRSRCVNQTQLTAATNSPVDQLSGRDDVFYPTEPNWTVIGSRNSIFTITMPNAFAAVQANSRIVLYQRGVLAQNTTSVQ